MTFRTKPISPDYHHRSKTNCWCGLCQRDLDPAKPRQWYAYELDNFTLAIHPVDILIAWVEIAARRASHHAKSCIVIERVGPECARRLGTEWVIGEQQYAVLRLAGMETVWPEEGLAP